MRRQRTSLKQLTQQRAAHNEFLNDGSLDCYFQMSKGKAQHAAMVKSELG